MKKSSYDLQGSSPAQQGYRMVQASLKFRNCSRPTLSPLRSGSVSPSSSHPSFPASSARQASTIATSDASSALSSQCLRLTLCPLNHRTHTRVHLYLDQRKPTASLPRRASRPFARRHALKATRPIAWTHKPILFRGSVVWNESRRF